MDTIDFKDILFIDKKLVLVPYYSVLYNLYTKDTCSSPILIILVYYTTSILRTLVLVPH